MPSFEATVQRVMLACLIVSSAAALFGLFLFFHLDAALDGDPPANDSGQPLEHCSLKP